MEFRMDEQFKRLNYAPCDACDGIDCPGAPRFKGLCNAPPKPLEPIPELKLYAIRNSKGQWFRAKGQSGSGDTWVDNFETIKVRLYPRLGTARAQVSYFANNYPEFPAPQIVEFTVAGTKILDEADRIAKTAKAKQLREAALEKLRKEQDLERAEIAFRRAKAELEKLKGSE